MSQQDRLMPTTPPVQEDLFGTPIEPPTTVPAPAHGDSPREPDPSEAVNDMDQTQVVLAGIVSGNTAPLHIDDEGRMRWCADWTTEPVPASVVVVVRQLLAAGYLTIRQRSCPGHGAEITAARAGRNTLYRWRAYRRPPAWGPPPAAVNHVTRTES